MQSDRGCKRQKRPEMLNLIQQSNSEVKPFGVNIDDDVTSYNRIMSERLHTNP